MKSVLLIAMRCSLFLLFVLLVGKQSYGQSDACGAPTPITSGTTCTPLTGQTVVGSTYTTNTTLSCGTPKYDVWYTFTATSANPTITLSNVGANFVSPLIQVINNTCATGGTTYGCGASPLNVTGLTIGTVYKVRVFSTTGAAAPATLGNFDICIQDPTPPANDLCANAINLTSGITCTNIGGTIVNATYTSGPTTCGGTPAYDVWYTFTAQSTSPTIAISSPGANFNTPRVQVFSGTCGGLTSVGCAAGSYNPTTLTVGTVYYIRVYSVTGPVPATLGTFNICITDPAPPANDACSGAVNLNSNASCSNTGGTLLYSTSSATAASCGTASSGDVWYKYTATTAYPTITLDYSAGGASSFKAASPVMEIYSGTCAGLTSIGCIKGSPALGSVVYSPALTVGQTYYIRIYTNTNTGAYIGSGNWSFNICITNPSASSPTLDYGKGYVNITKGASGGTIEPGDVLEIRATFVVKANTAYGVTFTDVIPANTTYMPGTLRILTNEGKIYQQFTDGVDTDPASITGSNVLINIGSGATAALGGAVRNTNRPTNFGSTCILVASYRVTVNAVSIGTVIGLGGGNIAYKNQPASGTNTITFPAYNAVVYTNYGICANTIGSNGVLSEFGGTFGSGNKKDRGSSSKVPTNYTYVQFSNGNPGDYYYGVSNNSSSGGVNYSFNPSDPVAIRHVFNKWDIIGDHTGAASPTAGNAAADTTGGKTGGYMVVINAAYRPDTAFLDTVKNLCPNTYYEYSAWFRNMCKDCGADSNGVSPAAAGYILTGPGDSSGVHANLTFNINGKDYYSSGDILYNGQWIKKGFTYLTGPAETQMIINIRNNAPGGGGNDWAMDDIGVATCTPNLNLNPSTPLITLCYGNAATLAGIVQSYFNNYTEYLWEKSTNNGVSYTPTGFSGSGTPVFNGTDYTYNAAGPSFIGDSTTHKNIYRLRVASTATNLNDPNCSFATTTTVQVMVNNCMWVLKADLISFTGNLQNNNTASVQWSMVNEVGRESYDVEKSTDGIHWTTIGSVKANTQGGSNSYSLNDPTAVSGAAYYRIKINDEAQFKLSKTILLSSGKLDFTVKDLVNPFVSNISFSVIVPADGGNLHATILDMYGRAVKTYTQPSSKGIIAMKLQDISYLSNGTYFLKVEWQNQSITKKILKSN